MLIDFEIKKKKYAKIEEFVKKIKARYKEVHSVVKKLQEEVKIYIYRNWKEPVKYKKDIKYKGLGMVYGEKENKEVDRTIYRAI